MSPVHFDSEVKGVSTDRLYEIVLGEYCVRTKQNGGKPIFHFDKLKFVKICWFEQYFGNERVV